MTVNAVSFVAKSNTGKTTLLEGVIGELKRRGYTVGALKHDAHRFDIDHPGKDSHRLTAAGADTMLITSPEKCALVKKYPAAPPLDELLELYFPMLISCSPKVSSWGLSLKLKFIAGNGAQPCSVAASTMMPL